MGKNKRLLLIAVIAFQFLKNGAIAGTFPAGADTVLKFTPGTGIPHGHSSAFFPNNVLGLPSKSGSEFAAEIREEEICALNFGGEIVIGFKNAAIIDAPGPDFTIFENAFKSPIPPYIFAEPAKIAVSHDGVNFKEFPFDSLTLKGCAGLKPTYGKNNPFNPLESGGDSFDLAEIGIDSVRFIRITDITTLLQPGHPFYQAVLTGFDLDAVVGLHCVLLNRPVLKENRISVFKNETDLMIADAHPETRENTVEIFSVNGQSVFENEFLHQLHLPLKNLPHGAYIVVVKNKEDVFTEKIVIE